MSPRLGWRGGGDGVGRVAAWTGGRSGGKYTEEGNIDWCTATTDDAGLLLRPPWTVTSPGGILNTHAHVPEIVTIVDASCDYSRSRYN